MLDFDNDLEVNEDNIELYKWKSFFESILDIILDGWVTHMNFPRKDLCLKFGSKKFVEKELSYYPGEGPIEKIDHTKIFYCKVGVTSVFNAIAVNKKDAHNYLMPLELEVRSNGLKLIKISNSFIDNVNYYGPNSSRHIIRKKIASLLKEHDVIDYYAYHGQINGS